ncbi:energy transducer TonB [Pseudohalioglobus lutimaris]|uniref:Protein TonB n=1 Tax=Pseudohalioglobus lutimaris TaxID=1737061 RepID=A0A2N5X3U3_9GAMM|nr:energy transducer TonB [Pseudohalioglobus lutimaris]PLW69142.1 energy transducer TonB [Pseudohalioglobus lutimaris]
MNGNLTRLILGALLALPVAGGLFFIMQYLIATADPKIDDSKTRKVADIHMPEREIDTNVNEPKPDKVDDPEEPPPDLDTPDLDMDMDIDVVNTAPTASVDVEISTTGMSSGDGEYLPIVKVAPIYPRRAQTRGITGYCIVEYTVTTSGAIRDPVAVDCQPSGVFEKASVKAALKFKYKPRVVDGEAIEVAGVQNKFTYELEQ